MSIGIYIHIPFCSRRCDYCDFATWTDKSDLAGSYIDAVVTQWKFHALRGDFSDSDSVASIFFGGGTPNLIHSSYIVRILDEITGTLGLDTECEITLESNPDHVHGDKCRDYVSAGVNRISLGVQSTDNEVLAFLGREHNASQVSSAIDIFRSCGIDNINCDLIYGSANEDLNSWGKTLRDIIAYEPDHISAYALGIESGTPLGRDVASGRKRPTNEDDLADKYLFTDELLSTNGFEWYEISNWSRPGRHSIHNQRYWHGGDVIALGCAAHGITGVKRWSTPRNITTYIESWSQHGEGRFIFHDPTELSREEERFALQFRTREGVQCLSLTNRIQELINADYIQHRDDRLILTPRGRLMAHSLTLDIFNEMYAQKNQ